MCEELGRCTALAPAEPVGGTPRTDAAMFTTDADGMNEFIDVVDVAIARQLEREVSQSNIAWMRQVERAEKAKPNSPDCVPMRRGIDGCAPKKSALSPAITNSGI